MVEKEPDSGARKGRNVLHPNGGWLEGTPAETLRRPPRREGAGMPAAGRPPVYSALLRYTAGGWECGAGPGGGGTDRVSRPGGEWPGITDDWERFPSVCLAGGTQRTKRAALGKILDLISRGGTYILAIVS